MWLDWPGCSLRSLPSNFHPKKLFVLEMPRSCITRLWEGFKAFPNLTTMNFESCEFLGKIPDFTGIMNLKNLILNNCTSLVEVHPSIGFLNKLVVLRLRGCSNLVIFSRKISLKSLEVIDLSNCFRLEHFPVIVGKMESLRHMNLEVTAIKELHSSIGFLIGLEELYLSYCEDLTTLPSSIYELQNLKVFELRCCKRLQEIPKLPPNLRWLIASDGESWEGFSKFRHYLKLLNTLNQPISVEDHVDPEYIHEYYHHIPEVYVMEEVGLAIFAVWEVIPNESTDWRFGVTVSTNYARPGRNYEFSSCSRKITSPHLWIKHIPLTGIGFRQACAVKVYFKQGTQPAMLKSYNIEVFLVSNVAVGNNYQPEQEASLFLKIDNPNVGHHQEPSVESVITKQDDTNVHQEQAKNPIIVAPPEATSATRRDNEICLGGQSHNPEVPNQTAGIFVEGIMEDCDEDGGEGSDPPTRSFLRRRLDEQYRQVGQPWQPSFTNVPVQAKKGSAWLQPIDLERRGGSGSAFAWYINLPPNSVQSWEELVEKFHEQLYRPGMEMSVLSLARMT
ncbi:uncharacterized protein LOC125468079 [Pyrus x bretschneideri]|uniref:uncharacterized protein LOC125468079 n=1 Tax=Pyrus x bretschneideri TaxID=225117 RepID=UPI00202E2805|nr:uncharacterized protein LOC125468079 [Pyrus x bretschneideri]